MDSSSDEEISAAVQNPDLKSKMARAQKSRHNDLYGSDDDDDDSDNEDGKKHSSR
jgi:hypothetical protein